MVCAELCKRLHEEKYHDRKIISMCLFRKQVVDGEKIADQDSQLLGRMIGKHMRSWWH
jgi:hypothetical protein